MSIEYRGGRNTNALASPDSTVASSPTPSPPRHALIITATRKNGEIPGSITGVSMSVKTNAAATAHTAISHRWANSTIRFENFTRTVPSILTG